MYINTTGRPEQGASNQIYNTLDFISKAAKAPVRPTDAFVDTAHSTAEATLSTHHTDGTPTDYYGPYSCTIVSAERSSWIF